MRLGCVRVRVSLRTSKPHNRIGFRQGPATAAPTARPPRIADARALHVEDRVWTPRTRETLRGLLLRALAFVFVCAALFFLFPLLVFPFRRWRLGLWLGLGVRRSQKEPGRRRTQRRARCGHRCAGPAGGGVRGVSGVGCGGWGIGRAAGTDGDGMVVCVCARLGCW